MFNNNSNLSKFSGTTLYQNTEFEYDVYLIPSKNQNETNEIIQRISSRKRMENGVETTCLGIDKALITFNLDNDNTCAYVFVREKGTQDEGSGSLQIYNWCSLKRKYHDEYNYAQVWINDVCRITPPGTQKSKISPIKVLFILFEQLAAQNINKNDIYLMVEPNEYNILGPIYNNYGFTKVPYEDCKKNRGKDALVIMKKNISKDPNYDNFPFTAPQVTHVIGGKRRNKKSKTIRKRKNKRKTIKRRY